jgi:hypothetical protein
MKSILLAIFSIVIGYGQAQAQTELYGGGSLGASYYADYTGSLSSIVATSVANANPGTPIVAIATQNRGDFGLKVFGGGDLPRFSGPVVS